MKTQTLSSVSRLYDGPHATPKPADAGGIFLGIKNITEDGHLDFSSTRFVSKADMPKWTKRVTPKAGDIVFTYEATLHRYAVIPDAFYGCLGRRTALIRADPERINPRFLYFYLRSYGWRRQIEKIILVGATVNRIPLTKVPDLLVPDLPVKEQKAIADRLDCFDNQIADLLRQTDLLAEARDLLLPRLMDGRITP